MAITLKQIATKRQSATIDFDGEELHVEFYPQRISPKMLASFAALDTETADPHEIMERLNLSVGILVTLLADWDMVESIDEQGVAGPKVPIDAEHLSEMGLPLLWAIIAGVMGASQMGK